MAEENWDKHRAVDLNGAQLSGGSASKMLLGPRQAAHPAAAATPLETSIRIASSARAGGRQKTCSSPPRRIGRNFEAVERQPASIGAYVIPDARYQNTKRHCSPLARVDVAQQSSKLYCPQRPHTCDNRDIPPHLLIQQQLSLSRKPAEASGSVSWLACRPAIPLKRHQCNPCIPRRTPWGHHQQTPTSPALCDPLNPTSPVFLQTQIRSFRWGKKSPEVPLLIVSNLPSR